MGYAEEIEVWT